MKLKKMLLPLLFVLLLLLNGCDYEAIMGSVVNEPTVQTTQPEIVLEPFVGFSETDVVDVEQWRQLKRSDLQNYTSQYSQFNSYTYFSHLNDAERLLYHIYEYALDEALPYFWIDERLLQGMVWPEFEVLEFFSLDSAMMEQNFSFRKRIDTVTNTQPNVRSDGETYICIYVENFSQDKLKHKKRAMQEARVIYSLIAVNKSATDLEKAEFFYDYLGSCAEYKSEIEGEEYLYNGLVIGQTNCDGFANGFAMLCGFAGIPCIEVNSDTPVGEVGHTWNMVYLEGRWVHVDATGAFDDYFTECEYRSEERVYFGFPDALLEERVLYADMLPTCPEGLTPILHLSSEQVEYFNYRVRAAFEGNDNKWVVVLLDRGELDDQTIQDLIMELKFGLYYVYYQTTEGKMVYYLFNNET